MRARGFWGAGGSDPLEAKGFKAAQPPDPSLSLGMTEGLATDGSRRVENGPQPSGSDPQLDGNGCQPAASDSQPGGNDAQLAASGSWQDGSDCQLGANDSRPDGNDPQPAANGSHLDGNDHQPAANDFQEDGSDGSRPRRRRKRRPFDADFLRGAALQGGRTGNVNPDSGASEHIDQGVAAEEIDAPPHQVADARLGDPEQLRGLDLRQVSVLHQLADREHQRRAQFEVRRFLLAEAKIQENIAARRRDLAHVVASLSYLPFVRSRIAVR